MMSVCTAPKDDRTVALDFLWAPAIESVDSDSNHVDMHPPSNQVKRQ